MFDVQELYFIYAAAANHQARRRISKTETRIMGGTRYSIAVHGSILTLRTERQYSSPNPKRRDLQVNLDELIQNPETYLNSLYDNQKPLSKAAA